MATFRSGAHSRYSELRLSKRSALSSLFVTGVVTVVSLYAIGPRAFLFLFQINFIIFILLRLLALSLRDGATIFHPLPLVSVVLIWAMGGSLLGNILTDHYVMYPPKYIDLEPWALITSLFYTACISFFALGAVMAQGPRPQATMKLVHRASFYRAAVVLMAVGIFAQCFIYYRFSGVYGMMEAYTFSRESFAGLGKWFLLAEPFPIIGVMFALVVLSSRDRRRSGLVALLVLVLFFVSKMLFGGLRGSRSNTIWGVFWAAGIIHLCYYRFKPHHFVVGACFLVCFMLFYGLYKSYGVEVLTASEGVFENSRLQGVNPIFIVLLEDLSRSGMHSYLLSEYFERYDYSLKWGETYLSAVSLVFPFLDLNHLVTKGDALGELFYHQMSRSDSVNSRIGGLFGEGLLNFGPVIAALMFFPVGFLIGRVDKLCRSIRVGDARMMLIPFLSNVCLVLILSDLDNVVFFVLKNGFLPSLLVVGTWRSYRVWAMRDFSAAEISRGRLDAEDTHRRIADLEQ